MKGEGVPIHHQAWNSCRRQRAQWIGRRARHLRGDASTQEWTWIKFETRFIVKVLQGDLRAYFNVDTVTS